MSSCAVRIHHKSDRPVGSVKEMGRDDGRRDDWGRDAYYDRHRDRDRYRDRSYGRDERRHSYGRDDRHSYSRDSRDRYDRCQSDSRDRYRSQRSDRYRSHGGRDRPHRGGFRGRGRFGGGNRFEQDQDAIDKEEEEYIKKRQEVLKARRKEEEQYVAEDVDTAALAAMGLPTGFGAPQERDAMEEGDSDDQNKTAKERAIENVPDGEGEAGGL